MNNLYRSSPAARAAAGTARRGGFTLVELLVVIGIIALLMSILLPTLGRVREQANSIKCSSNLRQVGQALLMYATQSGGFTAPFRNDSAWWSDPARQNEMIDPNYQDAGGTYKAYWGVHYAAAGGLTKEVFACPSEQVRTATGTDANQYIHYGFNSYGGQNSGFSDARRTQIFGGPDEIAFLRRQGGVWLGKRLTRVRHTTQTVFAQDAYETVLDGNGDTFVNWYQWPGKEFEWLRHNKRGNAVFLDGHVESLSQQQQTEERYYTGRW
ncbi:MAG TPA: prepilin-type N-terminal cleavage/methylation domain-containing protein [Humisphaera sp.]